ncbi:MAG: hypothetical protein JWM57_1090 [Phycisphaerales bacterium]|nr:hypothetical protein [Phycisphaerales bacterium]
MEPATIIQYIAATFPKSTHVQAGVDWFFFSGDDQKMPFATIVATDAHDQASDLSREGAYRLNVGVSRETYAAMFGYPPKTLGDGKPGSGAAMGHDFAAIDRIMPHPVYAAMAWVCVVNPSESTFESVQPMLAEAYELAAARDAKRS